MGRFTAVKWIGLFIGLILVFAFAIQLPPGRILHGQNDFLQFYGGATLAGTGKLHSPQAMEQVQRRVAGIYLPAVQFVRPDYYAVLLKPLSWLPFSVAYAAFQTLNVAALVGFLWLLRNRMEIRWLVPISIPLLVSFANGQDVPLLLFLLTLGLQFEKRGWPVLAGICLSLCTIKLHFLLFIPLVLLLWRKWQVIVSGISTMGALIALGAWFEGWDWILRYPSYLTRPEIHPDNIQFLNLRGIAKLWPSEQSLVLVSLSVLVAILVIVSLCRLRQVNFEHSIAISLLGAMLLSFHIGVHDCAILLLICALAPPASTLANVASLLSFPVIYFLLLADGFVGAIPAAIASALLIQVSWSLLREKTG